MKKKEALYFLLFAAFTIISFYPVFFSNRVTMWLDMTFYFLPFRDLTSHLIRAGIMPFWNPYIYGGNPLMANMQSAVFYPLNIFFHLFSFHTGLMFYIFLTYFIMACFMYKFLEICGISQEGAFAGASIFAFGFYAVIKAPEMAELSTLAWMPAALYFTARYAVEKKIHNMALIVFALSLSLLGGHPQFFIYCWLVFALYYFYMFLVKKREKPLAVLRDFALIHLAFAAVTAIQWVPTLRFLLNSKRFALGFDLAQLIGSYMNYTQLVTFFCPVFGMLLPATDNFMNWAGKIDIGAAGLLLLPLGVFALKDRRLKTLLLSVFAVVLFMAYLGQMPFFIPLYEHFRFIGVFRYPSRIIVAVYFIMCYFIAYGFDALFLPDQGKRKKYALFAAAVFACFSAVYFAVLYNEKSIIRAGMDIFGDKRNFQDVFDKVEQYGYIINDYFIFILLCGASAAVFALAALERFRGTAAKYSALVLVVISVLVFNKMGYKSFGDYGWNRMDTSQMKILEKNAVDGYTRVLAPNIINPFDFVPEIDDLKQWAYYAADSLAPNTVLSHDIYNSDGFDSLFLGSYHRLTSGLMVTKAPWRRKTFALLSAKYIASGSVIKDTSLKQAGRGYSILYETGNYFNRLFFLPGSVNTALLGDDNGIKLMLEDGFDPGRTLILDKNTGFVKDKYPAPADVKTSVNIKPCVNTNEINANVENGRAGWLVCTDNYYPGWKVFVDNAEKPLVKAYTTFKAVFLEAGSHNVSFRYYPPEFTATASTSFAALLLAAFFAVLALKPSIGVKP
jgi:hypothetical protein